MARQIPEPKGKDPKALEIKWGNFARGLNTLISPQKIRDDELSKADNIILEDEGTPMRRWGTQNFGNDIGTSQVDGLYTYYGSGGTSQLLALAGGFLRKYNSATGAYDMVNGASFSTGVQTDGVMALDNMYFVNNTDGMYKYDGTSLIPFNSVSLPGSTWTTRGNSLVSGPYANSYRISAVNAVGETLATSSIKAHTNLERSIWNTDAANLKAGFSVNVNWTPSVGATGYNIYGVVDGSERYLDHVDGQALSTYQDYGYKNPSEVFTPPEGDNTGGQKGTYLLEFKGSILVAGDSTNPSRVHFSAGADKVDSFLISDGGGWIDVSKNSEDGKIKGLGKFQDQAVIFKERSIWGFNYSSAIIPTLTNIINGTGTLSHQSITNVENDLFFLGRKAGGGPAIYVLGNEPNYFSVLRTNELSSRIRDDLASLNISQAGLANGVYFDGKYILFFADGSDTQGSDAVVYDRERLGFSMWQSVYAKSSVIWYDSNEAEYFLWGDSNDGRVTQMSTNLADDKGAAISWAYKTKLTDINEPFLYKNIHQLDVRLRNVGGVVNLLVHFDSGPYTYTQTLSSSQLDTAFRNLKFRVGRFRKTLDGNTTAQTEVETRRILTKHLGNTAVSKVVGFEVAGTNIDSKAGLLDLRIVARPKSSTFYEPEEIIL